MMLNDESQTVCRHARGLVAIVAGLVAIQSFACAQPSQALTPPVPIGTSNVPYGPPAPYGQAPVAIGPGPVPIRYGARYPMVSPYPQPNYPPMPPRYWYRQPTPFDPTLSARPPVNANPAIPLTPIPQGVDGEAYRVTRPIDEAQAMVAPPAIGNLRVSVSEAFVNRIVARNEQKPGEVRDFILGAQVSGHQTTETRLRFDVLPNSEKIRAALILDGLTQSQTTGVTPQAMVDVASQQQFMATKELYFDGTSISTRHAVVHVRANNQTLGAKTPLSGTLFGGIADRIAYREAERRKTEAEAIARDKVAERVYPEFDSQIDKQLALANDHLENTVRKGLRLAGLMPTQQQAFSTNTYLQYSAQMTEDQPSTPATSLEAAMNRDEGVNLLLHESFLKAIVARANLKGLKTTDKDLKASLAPYEVKPEEGDSTGDSVAPPQGLGNFVTDIEFDAEDPLTIRLEQNLASVTIRAKFKPAGQDFLPPLAITIGYKTEIAGEKILVTPTEVQVKVANRDDSNDPPSLGLSVLSQAIKASISKLAFDRALPANWWTFGGVCPRVTGIRSDDGWAAISIN
ncbi:hypothetical protein [Schlesneria paludicola]|uniref:hypothetical protein n=1 Tax=Schlesneria paludicola TaxID=360056 RepID=UPI0012F8338F|nr:hypothetical protein [Schlesneria paludicola]